jgi:chromosome partitioning protein
MRILAIVNQKGGVGKTTTTLNLGAALARRGRRVLLVDMDPQSHLSIHLGCDPAALSASMYDVLCGGRSMADVLRPVGEHLLLAPAHIDLAGAEIELVSTVGRELVLRDALGALGRDAPPEFVLIDAPPSLGVLTLNILVAAGEVLVPVQPHFLPLQGVSKLLETVAMVRSRLNHGLSITGVVLCLYDSRTVLAREVASDIEEFFAAQRQAGGPLAAVRVFGTRVRRNVRLAEAAGHGCSIFQYAPNCNGARDYARLAEELLAIPPDPDPAPEAGAAPQHGAQRPEARP